MTDQELIAALRWNMMETGSLICLGCGHEHGCSTHGCAVLREAAERIERLGERQDDNPPLTLKELRGMDDNLVWVEDWHVEWYGEPRVGLERASEALTLAAWRSTEHYGEWWIAYRRKPEEDTKWQL